MLRIKQYTYETIIAVKKSKATCDNINFYKYFYVHE